MASTSPKTLIQQDEFNRRYRRIASNIHKRKQVCDKDHSVIVQVSSFCRVLVPKDATKQCLIQVARSHA